MFTQKATVTFRSGDTVEVVTDQSDVAAWEMWATKRGLRPSAPDRSLMMDMPVTFLRFAAWNALHRPGTGSRPDFDLWTNDVVEVSVEESETVDPTQATTLED